MHDKELVGCFSLVVRAAVARRITEVIDLVIAVLVRGLFSTADRVTKLRWILTRLIRRYPYHKHWCPHVGRSGLAGCEVRLVMVAQAMPPSTTRPISTRRGPPIQSLSLGIWRFLYYSSEMKKSFASHEPIEVIAE
jgi:hypothetical protein